MDAPPHSTKWPHLPPSTAGGDRGCQAVLAAQTPTSLPAPSEPGACKARAASARGRPCPHLQRAQDAAAWYRVTKRAQSTRDQFLSRNSSLQQTSEMGRDQQHGVLAAPKEPWQPQRGPGNHSEDLGAEATPGHSEDTSTQALTQNIETEHLEVEVRG